MRNPIIGLLALSFITVLLVAFASELGAGSQLSGKSRRTWNEPCARYRSTGISPRRGHGACGGAPADR